MAEDAPRMGRVYQLRRQSQTPEPLWREVLGQRLRTLRLEREETLAETAGRAGISPQYLSEVERGRKEPFQAWLTDYDVDWCWWALNPAQPQGTIAVAGRRRSYWGDPEPWGLLAPDWRGVANPDVLDLLRSLRRRIRRYLECVSWCLRRS